MSDNTDDRSPMISRAPWAAGGPGPASGPSAQPGSSSSASPLDDDGTRPVSRTSAGAARPPHRGPAAASPATPARSWSPASAASTPASAPSGRPAQPPHQVPLGSPPSHRVPGPGAGQPSAVGSPLGTPSGPARPPQPTNQQGPTGQPPLGQPGAGQPGAGPSGAPQPGTGSSSPATGGAPDPYAPPRQPAAMGGVTVPQPSRSAESGYPPRYGVNDLIEQLNPDVQVKSRKGWRARLGLKPSQRELAELRDDESVRMPFARPVTIMVANPKGGVGKTPTTLMLAAAMGVARGGGVIAWDNNELRGTMPDRSLSPHRRTVRDMLAEADYLTQPTAQFTDLSYYFNHQTTGKFHTLGSAQTSGHVISRSDFEKIHNILSRFFQVIIVDTGNNEASPNWQAAAEEADCLVVPTKWRKDSLIPAARMLETLQELNSDLLNRTVVVATNGPADSQATVRLSGAEFFGSYPIVEIPTDPHIAEGGVIDYTRLQEGTRRAAVALAAEVARAIEPVAGLSQRRDGSATPPRRGI